MGVVDSDYPGALDPPPVKLLEGMDYVPANALQLLVSQIAAVQGEVGNDPTLLTSLGAPHFGAIAALKLALLRVEGGTVTLNGSGKTEFPVAFTPGRFSAPPFVVVEREVSSSQEPTAYGNYEPKNVTSKGFDVGTSNPVPTTLTNVTVMWFAIQSPFGVEVVE